MIKKIIALGIFLLSSISFSNAIFPATITVTPGHNYESTDTDIENFTINEYISFSKPITYQHYFENDNIQLDYAFYRDENGYLHFYTRNQFGKTDYKIEEYNFVNNTGLQTTINQEQFIEYTNNNIHNIYSITFRFGYVCQTEQDVGTTFKITFDNANYIYITAGTCQENKLYISPGGGPIESETTLNIEELQTYKSPIEKKRKIDINTQCPTIGQLMRNMGTNYNTGLCYNNTKYFNGTTFETIDKQDIFTIFNNDYENYTNRVSIYQQTCRPPATTQACKTAFSGEYKKYSIIANAYNSNTDEKKLRNYCNMGLNYNPNTSTCIASGYINEEYTPEERLENIIGTTNEIGIPSTDLFNSICEGDECYEINRNFLDSLTNIYEKLTGLFRKRNGVEGIIPPYILRITFVTILFTIIFKK